MAWLWLTHPLALAAFWWLPGWAARRDAALFTANPASDDYHRVFHRQRLTERAGLFAAVAGLGSAPLVGHWGAYALSAGGLLCAGAGAWAYRFNPLLNLARALPYVPAYYVSPDPRAAFFPDRWLYERVLRELPATGAFNDAELTAARRARAGQLLRRLLMGLLLAGVTVYGLAIGAGLLLFLPH